MMKEPQQMCLSPYRVLDLTEGEFLLGGRMMGDLGADVIKIEKPGGSPSRKRGPFYKDIPDPEKSLFWFGFCLNKRSITLDIETADGQDIFKKLVASSHFILESFEPGYLDDLGLGYQELSKINPGIILASITPFGQTGPKAHNKWSELIGWASSGTLYPSGDPDRPPCVTALPLAGQQSALAAVLGSLTAHWHRKATGEGQQVDVSVQEVMEWVSMSYSHFWPCHQMEVTRVGWGLPLTPKVYNPMGTRCKDGYTSMILSAGAIYLVRAMRELQKWMTEEGMMPDWYKYYDWADIGDMSKFHEQAELDRVQKPVIDFLATRTKAELWRAAVHKGTLTGPVRDFKDNFEDPQLKERGFWVEMAHDDVGDTISYPGEAFKLSKSPITFRRRAPLIGEHNKEIYEGELGLSAEQVRFLKSNGAI